MRTFILRSALVIAAGMFSGCGSCMHTKPAAATQADNVAASKAWVMQSGGSNVLSLKAPDDTKCATGEGTLHFNGPVVFDEVEVWLMSGAKSVDEAMAHVNTQIADQFKDFKPDHTTDLMIAGSPAKRLVGPGMKRMMAIMVQQM